mmetsp:Transcript_19352/g.40931  ORF Transcript_19352/g.40931 Transcript_19352/m.40931 type:complete len:80 (-) Transcript_19352:1553-1792(-)
MRATRFELIAAARNYGATLEHWISMCASERARDCARSQKFEAGDGKHNERWEAEQGEMGSRWIRTRGWEEESYDRRKQR